MPAAPLWASDSRCSGTPPSFVDPQMSHGHYRCTMSPSGLCPSNLPPSTSLSCLCALGLGPHFPLHGVLSPTLLPLLRVHCPPLRNSFQPCSSSHFIFRTRDRTQADESMLASPWACPWVCRSLLPVLNTLPHKPRTSLGSRLVNHPCTRAKPSPPRSQPPTSRVTGSGLCWGHLGLT